MLQNERKGLHKAPMLLKSAIRRVVPRTMRNWLRSPSRSGQWIYDGLQFYCGITRKLQIAPDWSLKCHPRAYRVYLRDQVIDGAQAAEFHNFLSYCARGMLLFDIGSHFGIFSLAAAHAGGKAVAVDPSQDALSVLGAEARLNQYADDVQMLCAAVTSESGSIGLLSSGAFSAGYFKVAAHESESELTRKAAVTIDELTARFGAPTHIKIDIEGHEGAALRGATETFRRCSPLLFLEVHNEMVSAEGGDPRDTLEVLGRLGYEPVGFDGEKLAESAILGEPISRLVARRNAAATDSGMLSAAR
jgi:FkbM family methyltransferase